MPTKPAKKKPRKNRARQQLIIVMSVMAVVIVAGLLLPWGMGGASPAEDAEPGQAAGPIGLPAEPTSENEASAGDPVEDALIDDDGRTLWASPTAGGGPAPLDALPPGVQMVLSVRLSEMLATADGKIVGELFGDRLKPLESAGVRLEEIERLTIGIRQGERYGLLETTMVIDGPASAASGGSASSPMRAGRTAYGPVFRLSPTRLVIASAAAIEEIAEAAGEPPLLRREMEQLVEHSDRDRHATLLLAPSFLFAEGKPLLAGEVAALESPLFEETPDELRALMLSVHFGEDAFYWELSAASAAELTASRLVTMLQQRATRWPEELQLAVIDLVPDPHGRRVVANLPAMARVAARYLRRGVRDRHAVLNGYLPAGAGHNLLMAAELMLAQQSAGVVGGPSGDTGARPAATVAANAPPTSAAEALRRRASVSFSRDTLEMAVKYLADEVGVPIVIRGGDLQLEGITKNQSFGLDQTDQPAEAVLLEILAQANPDKTATGPKDLKQKLVYTVGRSPSGQETIYVTTRAAVKKNGEPLPPAFTP